MIFVGNKCLDTPKIGIMLGSSRVQQEEEACLKNKKGMPRLTHWHTLWVELRC